MHFNVNIDRLPSIRAMTNDPQVEGPVNRGVVNMHMIKRPSDSEFAYKYLALDVKGHQRIYLENADSKPDSSGKSKTKIFGVSWN